MSQAKQAYLCNISLGWVKGLDKKEEEETH